MCANVLFIENGSTKTRNYSSSISDIRIVQLSFSHHILDTNRNQGSRSKDVDVTDRDRIHVSLISNKWKDNTAGILSTKMDSVLPFIQLIRRTGLGEGCNILRNARILAANLGQIR